MRGLMCQSVEVTSGCTIPDPRSVIVPRRAPDPALVDSTGLSNRGRYSRIVEAQSIGAAPSKSRSVLVHTDKTGHNGIASSNAIQQPSSLDSSDNVFRVVVMRVSLHCQGCAGKVKKHLSKMEGVTSFSIDLETKRVTVRGHVSPAGVLESISKVKRAEFWPPS
ncbi:protein SODIUM POTASSIUM ROOT DEFECTIVE 3-like [Rhodamnia argentea]|uniref:Protein SODIUM POTASSIUM ROOT DEFECTIVE 3-like n=1 Tax=Rhodamnia argentea TaxID=178133 RepID=A0A8B8PX86_9MYRT|nr:protein SODIUM POTASSIUM ROOT DEFECTIVE 3-like [Rhodamnia argentea]